MTKRYHYNPDTGKTGICDAIYQCRFGIPGNEHFVTAQEAARAYEVTQGIGHLRGVRTSSSKALKYVAIGGVLVAAFSVGKGEISSITEPGPATGTGAATSIADRVSSTFGGFWGGEDAPIPQESGETDYAARDRAAESDAAARKQAERKAKADALARDAQDKTKAASQAAEDSGVFGKLRSGVSKAGSELKEAASNLPEALGESFETSPETVADKGDVYFQGKPLKPSANEVEQAQADLESLTVRPEKNVDYNREAQYGRSFSTGVVGRMEHRDVTHGEFKNSAPQSRAVGGYFTDPYTGERVNIVRGSSQDTNVDHVVSLHEATKSGADELSQSQRKKLANDPDNLAIVGADVNQSKSDSDAANFLPSYKPSQQRYVIAQIRVKKAYNLSVDKAEYNAMKTVLESR